MPGAFDPDRQLWVAATLYALGTRAHALLFGRMPDALADEVYARSAQLGVALQMPAELWPADRAAFARYWKDAVAGLEVTPEAREVAAPSAASGASRRSGCGWRCRSVAS